MKTERSMVIVQKTERELHTDCYCTTVVLNEGFPKFTQVSYAVLVHIYKL